jgi:hypothetical protein
MAHSLPVPTALVSCHLERPFDDASWRAFSMLQKKRPGGLEIAALIRPPHDGEDRGLWLERARIAAAGGPLGHHTHWTSPSHARPTGGNPAERVRAEAAFMRDEGLVPTLFCGGGWYMDEEVAEAVADLGYTDCTARGRGPCTLSLSSGAQLHELPTTHSLGQLARGVLWQLPPYVHAYFHDYDLLESRRMLALTAGLRVLALRRSAGDWKARSDDVVEFSEAFAR